MIPVLYDYSEKQFVSQGLGALVDAMSCIVEEELNGIYELTMTYPITGEHFDLLENQRLILAMPSKGTRAQPFEIYSISKPLNGVVTVNAQHISYRLSYIPVVPFTCNGCTMALQMMKANSLEENPFTVWTDITNSTRQFSFDNPQSFRLCLGGIEGSLVDRFYGEYEFDRFDVRFWSKRGTVRETAQIIYGKNLTDLKQEDSFEYVVTGIYPYWKSQETDGSNTSTTVVTLPEKVIYSKYADSYAYRRTVPYDFSQDFQEAPTVEALRERAKEYVQQSLSTTPSVNMSISFASLADSEENKNLVEETLNLGDTVSVYFSKLGISTKARITKTTFNVLIEQYDSLTIGSKSSLSKTISNMEKRNKEIESNQITISQVKNSLDAQKTIMDGAAGGSVITQYTNGTPSATIYTDTDNIETAKNALIMNKNGIAFSHNGVAGPYETAWTIDGQFSANFITTGQLDGNLIKGGTIIAGALEEDVQNDIKKGANALDVANTSVGDVYVEYGISSSSDIEPVSWSTETPQWSEGKFIWQRTKTILQNDTINYSEAVCIQGAKGESGEDAIVIQLDSTDGMVFKNSEIGTILTVTVYKGSKAINDLATLHNEIGASAYLQWKRKNQGENEYTDISLSDKRISENGFKLEVRTEDVDEKCSYLCQLLS